MRAPILISMSALLLALPAPAAAELHTFGSDLAAPASVTHEHQADTAFWPAAAHPVPFAGQIREVRIKGMALRRPDTRADRSVGGETMFHVQALDGARFRITSQAFDLPTTGDPQQVTSFRPENFCVQPGERIAFNTVGGYDGIGAQPVGGTYNPLSPYPMGTPLRIFAATPGATTDWYEQANGTDNGEDMAPNGSGPRAADQGFARSGRLEGQELLMQMTIATGDDRSYECGGPNTYRPRDADRVDPRVAIQKATLPAKQTVRVSRKGQAGMALFCFAGAGPCTGTVTVRHAGKAAGTARFAIAPKSTGKLKLRLGRAARKAFARRGRLAVTIVAVTAPGGPERTVSLKTVLRRHRA